MPHFSRYLGVVHKWRHGLGGGEGGQGYCDDSTKALGGVKKCLNLCDVINGRPLISTENIARTKSKHPNGSIKLKKYFRENPRIFSLKTFFRLDIRIKFYQNIVFFLSSKAKKVGRSNTEVLNLF